MPTISKIQPIGSVLQVKHTQLITANSVATTANQDAIITGMEVNITPILTNSIIKVECVLMGEHSNAGFSANAMFFFYRDSTLLKVAAAGNRRVGLTPANHNYDGSDAGSTPDSAVLGFFDNTHNTTSQITYKLGLNTLYTGTYYINKTVTDTNTNEYERGASFISATEIAP